MRKHNFLLGIGMLLISISCSEHVENIHCGDRKIDKRITMLDSIVVDADSTSGRGNFFMQDSSVYFADSYYMSLFRYNLADAFCVGHYWGVGQGPNELSSFLYAYPIQKGNGECFIMDSSLGMRVYRGGEFSLSYKGRLDFGWDNLLRNDYDSPSVYNLMEMTDFGIDFTSLDDSIMLIPISLVNRYLDEISEERYEKGHILAELNRRNMKVERVFGHFPEVYKDKPTPFFEFFQYALQDDTLYVNHATDSLIYVYKYPDELLYTIGYEVPEINRNYTIGYNVEMSDFKNDLQTVGVNSGLLYIPEKKLLFRTAMKNFSDREVCLQAYSGCDLVLEADMPDFFKLLGFRDEYFYGVRLLPLEEENGSTYFVFYRFKIEEL